MARAVGRREGRKAERKEAGGAKTQSGEKIGDDGFDHQSLLPYSITEIPSKISQCLRDSSGIFAQFYIPDFSLSFPFLLAGDDVGPSIFLISQPFQSISDPFRLPLRRTFES